MRQFIDLLQSCKIAPTCLSCGSYFRKDTFFCDSCFTLVTEKYLDFETSSDIVDSLNITTLFRWIPDASDALSRAIHLLKMAESKFAWKVFGTLFCHELLNSGYDVDDFENTILVPVPGSKSFALHTELFSQVLSEQLKMKKVPLLMNKQVNSSSEKAGLQQKVLSRRERLFRDFGICVDFTRVGELEKTQNIVLIDDVVTTGATLQACKRELKAIKPSVKISAWVMFRRL